MVMAYIYYTQTVTHDIWKVEDPYTFILFVYNTIMHVLIDLNDAGNVLIILTPYFVSCEAPILKLGLIFSSKQWALQKQIEFFRIEEKDGGSVNDLDMIS